MIAHHLTNHLWDWIFLKGAISLTKGAGSKQHERQLSLQHCTHAFERGLLMLYSFVLTTADIIPVLCHLAIEDQLISEARQMLLLLLLHNEVSCKRNVCTDNMM
jgi:hypothetical protein